jgi:O-antigen/teichoic acid export membrane protein
MAVIAASGLLGIAVARIAGTSATGQYGVAITLFSILLPVSTLGLRAGITFLVSRGEWPGRRALRESVAAAFVLCSIAAAITVAIYVAWPDGPLSGLGGWTLALTLAAVTFAGAWAFSSGIALALERYEGYAFSQIAQAAIAAVLGVALTFPLGVAGAMLGFATGQLMAAAIAVGSVLSSGGPPSYPTGTGLTELRRAARFGTKTWVSEMFWGLNFRLDVLILNTFVASSAVGVYFVAGSLTTLAWVLPAALQNVVLPRAAALDASVQRGEGHAAESDATVARSLRHGVLLSLPTGIGLVVLLVVGVPLFYGPGFGKAILYGFILMPGVLAAGLGKVAAGVLIGRGRPGYTLLPMLITTPVTILAYLIVIPVWEVVGAAVVSTISYTLTAAITVYLVRRVTDLPLRGLLRPRSSDVTDYLVMFRNARQYLRDRVPRASAA